MNNQLAAPDLNFRILIKNQLVRPAKPLEVADIRISRIILMITVLLVLVLAGILLLKWRVQCGTEKLLAYENSVAAMYSTDGVNLKEEYMEEALNLVEAYIRDHQLSLMIKKYNREDSTIEVRFYFGITHIYMPLIEGFD